MRSQESAAPVLIAGAGPTGLVLALNLARRGVPYRLIDDEAGPGDHSRAMVVHARTLEFYRQFGFADEVVAGGVEVGTGRLREGGDHGGREVLTFSFRDMGKHQSPFTTPLAYPQDDHERLLVAKLSEAGGEVEWNTKLESFSQDADGVEAVLRRDGGRTETVRAAFLCGCDGGHSTVRRGLGVGFTGGTYEQLYYVADVSISRGFERDFVLNMGVKSFALLLPVRSRGVQRIVGLVPVEFGERSDVTFDEIRDQIERLVDVKVTEVNWFSTYKVHHRVAEHFQVGRAGHEYGHWRRDEPGLEAGAGDAGPRGLQAAGDV
jgi:2-polyprenyl-6-methoxyphenol hydroxylase-like FAD-dependent oxidoreductase